MGQLGAQLGNPGIQGGANGQSQYFPPAGGVQAAGPSTPGQNPPAMLGEQDNAPTQSKGHKLLQILGAGLQGALAGRAAQEQMIAQTGGRRAGGVGTGFEAGFTLPWQRAQMTNQLAQQQAQTGLLQSEAQTTNIPGVGAIPGWLAKTMGPAWLRQQGELGKQQLANQGGVAKQQLANQGQAAKAQIEKRFMAVPNVGVLDTQDPSGKPTLVPGSAQGIQLTQEHLDDYGLPKEFLGKFMNLSQLAQLERVQNQGITTVQGESGPALVNKQTKQVTNLGLGNPGMGKGTQVGDPNNPGQTTFSTMGNAIRQGLPGTQSASVQVPKQAAASEVPTKIGDQKVAFNTAAAHADLLRQAAKALNNGDERTLAGLSNRAQTEFGDSSLTDFNAIAGAYSREITKMLSAGHMTDAEIGSANATIPSNANYATIDKVLSSYQKLAKSKLNQLNQQKQNAVNQAQPNKNAPSNSNSPGITIKRDDAGRIIGIQ